MTPLDVFEKLAAFDLTVDEAVDLTDRMVAVEQARRCRKVATAPAVAAEAGLFGARALDTLLNAARTGLSGAQTVSNIAGNLAPWALAATVGPGYLLGRAAAEATDVGRDDIADIQENELIDELQANATRLRKLRAIETAGVTRT